MKIAGKQKFLGQIAALPRAMKDEIRKALEVSADETTDLMKRFVPVRSGALRASIGFTFGEYTPDNASVRGLQSTGTGATELTVTMHAGDAKAWYAGLVEFGTRKHMILPREPGGKLRLNGGRFVDEVEHPGSDASPFFLPAYRFGKKRARSRLARAVRNGARKAMK
ncbi:HK97-gp10 family putative phage morphogenesis protein [Mesorhizobium amorphae]|uniref:HK97-gp10 family putative phage morphogenesis protein n=1 Tax=Mesorhizobium amorphae TaxID=71433 RepID=UPI001183D888|nr:HK97-gp10 family putative phage morphogenesis protein [Mesorhizobium amorphae]